MSEEINVNVKGADEIIAATKAAEAERIRLAAQQAMGASGTGGLGGLGGNNFSAGQYQRYVDAYQKQKLGQANRDAVDRLRNYQSVAGAVKRGEASFLSAKPPAASYVRRASKKFAQIIAEEGGGGGIGGVGSDVISKGGGPFDPPRTPEGIAWHKQAGLGTNKVNAKFSTPGGGFNKSFSNTFSTSAAKGRGVVNVMRSLGKGNLPAIARSSMVMWGAQELATGFKNYADEAFKDISPSASADEHALAFHNHLKIGVMAAMNNMAKTGLGIMGLAAVGTAGLVDLIGGAVGVNTAQGGKALKWYHQAESTIERFYTGRSPAEAKFRAMSDQSERDFNYGERMYERNRKYVEDFADRNADELAALGFGSGAQTRRLAAESEAAKRLKANVGLVLAGKDTSELEFDGSDGDD